MNLDICHEVKSEMSLLNRLFLPLTRPTLWSNFDPPLDETRRSKDRGRRKEKEGREAGKGRKAKLSEGRPAGRQEETKSGQRSGGIERVTRTGFCQ